jgi:hypothetical protein
VIYNSIKTGKERKMDITKKRIVEIELTDAGTNDAALSNPFNS